MKAKRTHRVTVEDQSSKAPACPACDSTLQTRPTFAEFTQHYYCPGCRNYRYRAHTGGALRICRTPGAHCGRFYQSEVEV